jgi:alcohol dehydrogenase class IV
MVKFDFSTPTRILFGPGVLAEAAPLVRELGRHALLVTGSHPERADALVDRLERCGIRVSTFATNGEPTVSTAQEGATRCRSNGVDMVIGHGGGSALDAAKAMAALATNEGDPLDYLEVIGKGQPLTKTPLPFVAIPTTAGTGSEGTRNAVLASPEHKVKVSLRHPLMLARIAVVDPELTVGLPPETTATTGMDALTQCIEAYVSCKANPLTDGFSAEGIRRAASSLQRAFSNGDDLTARSDMALASLYSGMALANAGLGAVHGFAGPIGGMFPAPHGAVCAALLPHVMECNLAALKTRQPDDPKLSRFDEIGRWLTQDPGANAVNGIEWLMQLQSDLRIPGLIKWGVEESGIPVILPKAAAASSMKGNPIRLTDAELGAILKAAL